MNKQPMQRSNFYFPKPLMERLRFASEQTGMPMSVIIRRAIDQYLKERGL